jgi:hypothetical protein
MTSRTRVLGLVAVGFMALAFVAGVVAGRASTRPPRATSHAAPPGPAQERTVSLYGDALLAQSRAYFVGVGDAYRVKISIHAFDGAAPCDLLPTLRDDVTRNRPDAVVLAYGADAGTPCMRGDDGRPLAGMAFLARYAADIHEAVTTARQAGARVVVASPPAARGGVATWQEIDALYRKESAGDPAQVTYVDGGILIAPDGRVKNAQPCLPFELTLRLQGRPVCDAGMVTVRAADGTNLCPTVSANAGSGAPCPTYSSGATRFALTLLSTARLDLDLAASRTPASTRTTSPADRLAAVAAQCRRQAESTKRTTPGVRSLTLQRGLVWAACMADRGGTCTSPVSRTQLPGAVCEVAGTRIENPYYRRLTPPPSN